MLEFILDGQSVTEPEGLRDLNHRIYYNEGLNGYLEQIDGQVSFYGSEYTYLRNRFFADGCSIVNVTIRNGLDVYEANIFLNDAEWYPDLNKVECELVDASYLSLIDNNQDIKAYLNVPRSKNDVDISAYTVVQTNLTMKEVSNTDTPTPADRYGIRVFDAFRFLIAFMSDGQLGFVSDYFNPETNPAQATQPRNPTLMTGYSVRTGPQVDPDDEEWPYISFEELYTDINKIYNITFSIEQIAGVPTIRIEPKGYFRNNIQTIVLPDSLEVRQSADRDSYYQLVKFGSNDPETKEFDYYPEEPLQSWRKEEYHLGGQCNTKSTLDLQLRVLITDPNVIMDALPISVGGQDNDENDEDIFLIVFDGNNETIRNPHPVLANTFFYNNRLSNLAVANNWGDGVPFPIYQFLGADDNQAKVGNFSTTNLTVCALDNLGRAFGEFQSTIYPYGFDPNNNIVQGNITTACVNPATYYEVPSTGVYTVNARLILSGSALVIRIARFDQTDILQEQPVIWNAPQNSQGSFILPLPTFFFTEITGGATFAAQTGDKLCITFEGIGIQPVPVGGGFIDIHDGSFMEVPGRGLITKTYNPADNWLLMSETTCPIPADWWRQFRQNWHALIQLTYATGQAFGYVKEIKRPIYSGDAEVSIVSKFADVTR